jgi:hypothetical protein
MPESCCNACFNYLLYNGTKQSLHTVDDLAVVCAQHVGCCTILLTGRVEGICEHDEQWVQQVQDAYDTIRSLESQHPSRYSYISGSQYIAWGPICLQAPSADNIEEAIKNGRTCKGFEESESHLCDRDVWSLIEDAPASRLGTWEAKLGSMVLCMYSDEHTHR